MPSNVHHDELMRAIKGLLNYCYTKEGTWKGLFFLTELHIRIVRVRKAYLAYIGRNKDA